MVTMVTPNMDNTRGGSKVTINGFNFGVKDDSTREVEFPNSGITKCISWKSSSQIVVLVPAGYGTGHIIVRIGEGNTTKQSNATNSARFSYNTPEVYTISPLGKQISETNTVVTIRGRYFGWRDSQPLIKIGDYECENEENVTESGLTYKVRRGWVSDSELFCRLIRADKDRVGQVTVQVGQLANGTTKFVPSTVLSSEKSAYPIYFSFTTPRGIVLPTAPTSLRVTLAATQTLRASWSLPYNTGSGGSAVAKILKYRVQVSSTFTYSALNLDQEVVPCDPRPCTTSVDASGLVVGTLYYVRVAAINAAGQGPWQRSSKIAATVPSLPLTVTAVPSGPLAVTVRFNRPADTGAGGLKIPLVRYLIRMTRVNTDATPSIKDLPYNSSSASEEIVFDGLVKGGIYSVEVAAVNEIPKGTSGYTKATAVQVRVASVAGVVTSPALTRPSPDSIAVSWTAPADSGYGSGQGDFTLTGYEVAYSTTEFSGLGDSGVQVRTLSNTELTTTFTGLTTGQFYFYSVRATSIAGKGVWTDNLKLEAASAPSAPQNLTISPAVCPGANANWTMPKTVAFSTTGSVTDATYLAMYTVDYADDAAFTTGLVSQTTTNLSTTLPGLTKGKIYYFRARANNTFGWNGANSAQTLSTSVTGASVPSSPLMVTAAAGLGSGVLEVSWSIPQDTGDGSSRFPLTGFTVEYSSASDFATVSVIEVTESNQRMRRISGLSSATLYYIRVSAKNACGSGSASAIVSATPMSAPSSPSALNASPSGDDVLLTWTAPSSAVTSYRIGMKSDISTEVTYMYSDDITSNQYTVMSLEKGYKYTFEVSAGNMAGYSSPATQTLMFRTVGQIQVSPSGGPVNTRTTVFFVGRVLEGSNAGASTTVLLTQGGSTSYGTISGSVQFESQAGGSAVFRFAADLPTAPAGVAGLTKVTVSVAGQTFETSYLFGSYDVAEVVHLNPGAGPSKGGGECAIVLRNFPYSSNPSAYTVNFNTPTRRRLLAVVSSVAIHSAHAGDSLITLKVVVPSGGSGGVSTVSVKSGAYSASSSYVYYSGSTGVVENVVPTSGSKLGGNKVILHVRNWSPSGTVGGSMKIGTETKALTVASETSACSAGRSCYSFTAPQVALTAAGVATVTVTDAGTSTSIKFSYYYYVPSPAIVSVTPSTALVDSTSSSVDVLMQGLDGNVNSASDVSISFGGVASTGHLLSLMNDGFVLFRVTAPPSSVVKSVPIEVTLTKDPTIKATSVTSFQYLGPSSAQVVEVVPGSGSVSGGVVISVRLKGATYSTSVSATFQAPSGSTAAGTILEMVGDEVVLIQTPASPNAETGLSTVTLIVGSYSTTFSFTYSPAVTTAAVVDFVQPAQVYAGQSMMISLTNFNVISSASEVSVMFGSSTPATVTGVQSSSARTTLFVTVPKYQTGMATVNVIHTSSTTNAGIAQVEVFRFARCSPSNSNMGWYNNSFGRLPNFGMEREDTCRDDYSPYPTIVDYAPMVGYFRDKASNTRVSVIVDHLPQSPNVKMELYDTFSSILFESLNVTKMSGFSSRYIITGTVPMVNRDAGTPISGIVTVNDYTPAVVLPFEFVMYTKPTDAGTGAISNEAVVEAYSTDSFSIAGSEEIRVLLSNFVQISEAKSLKTINGVAALSVTDVSVFVGGAPCTVLAAKSDPFHTSLKFLTPPGPHQPGQARVTIRNDANIWNTVTYAANYVQSNTPQIGFVFPTDIPVTDVQSSAGTELSFSINLNQKPGDMSQKFWLEGQSPNPVTFRVDGINTLNATKSDIRLSQDNGMLYVTLTLSSADFVNTGSLTRNGHYVEVVHASLKDASGSIRATFNIITSPTATGTVQVLEVTPPSVAARVKSQQVEVVSRGFSPQAGIATTSATLRDGAQTFGVSLLSMTSYKSNEYHKFKMQITGELVAGRSYTMEIRDLTNSRTLSFPLYVANYDPYVKSMYPAQGPTCGGTDVTVTVQQYPDQVTECTDSATKACAYIGVFVGDQQVKVKYQKRDQYTGDLKLTFTTPPLAAQVTTIRIAGNPSGQAGDPLYVATGLFRYTDLNVVAVSPTSLQGPATGGTRVVFRIKDLGAVDASTMSVFFGQLRGLVLAASMEDDVRYSKVTVVAPAQSAQTKIDCTLNDGNGRTYPFTFTYNPEGSSYIASVSPAMVQRGGGEVVEVRIRGFPYLGPDASYGGNLTGSKIWSPSVHPDLDVKVQLDGIYCVQVAIKRQAAEYTDIVFETPPMSTAKAGFGSVPLSINVFANSQDAAFGTSLTMTRYAAVTGSMVVGQALPSVSSVYPKTVSAGEYVQVVVKNLGRNGPVSSASQIRVSVAYAYWMFASDLVYSRREASGDTVTAVMVKVPSDATAGNHEILLQNIDTARGSAVTATVQVLSPTLVKPSVKDYTSVSGAVDHRMFTYLLGQRLNFTSPYTFGPMIRFVTPSSMPASGLKTVYIGVRLRDPENYKFTVTMDDGVVVGSPVVTQREFPQVCDYTHEANGAVACEASQNGSYPTKCVSLKDRQTPKCLVDTVVLEVQVPSITTKVSEREMENILVVKHKTTSVSTNLRFTQLLYHDTDSIATVISMVPSEVPMTGGVEVRMEIGEFNNGISLLPSQVRVFLSGDEVTVLHVDNNPVKTVIIFLAPMGKSAVVPGVVVPMNDASRSVSFELPYVAGCNYEAFCGEEGVNKAYMSSHPPLSTSCLMSYCVKSAPSPELRYGSTTAYTSAVTPIVLGVKSLPSVMASDLIVSFGEYQGAVTRVTRGGAVSEVTVMTPYVSIAQQLTMTLSSMDSEVGVLSVPFRFFAKPTGTSSLVAYPTSGALNGGTAVKLSLTNFPKITSTSETIVSFNGVACTNLRLATSDVTGTEIIATVPDATGIGAAAGAGSLQVSYRDGLATSNTGTASWTYNALDARVAWSYPAKSSYLGGSELVVGLTGFPIVTSAAQIQFTFSSFTTVSALMILSSDVAVTKVKVIVPAAGVGEVGQKQMVKVEYLPDALYTANFPFEYSAAAQVSTVDWVMPTSAPVTGGTELQLRILNWIDDPSVDLSTIVVSFGNVRAVPTAWEQSGTAGLLKVTSPVVGAAGIVRTEVYRIQDAEVSTRIASFDFMFTEPAIAFDVSSAPNYLSRAVVATIDNFNPSGSSSADWRVSFMGVMESIPLTALSEGYSDDAMKALIGKTTITFSTPITSMTGVSSGTVHYMPSGRSWNFMFTFTARPTVVSILPRAQGSYLGGTSIQIKLQDFPVVSVADLPNIKVRFGLHQHMSSTMPLEIVPEILRSDQDYTVLKLRTPPATFQNVSSVPVRVTGPGGVMATFSWDYVPECAIISVVPAFAPSYGGGRITISGTGFPMNDLGQGWESDVAVRFGDSYGKVIQVMGTGSFYKSSGAGVMEYRNDGPMSGVGESAVIVVEAPPMAPGLVRVSVLMMSSMQPLFTGEVHPARTPPKIMHEADWERDFAIYDKFSMAYTDTAFLTAARKNDTTGAWNPIQREAASGVQGNAYNMYPSVALGSSMTTTVMVKNLPIAGFQDISVKLGSAYATVNSFNSTHLTFTPPTYTGGTYSPLQISYAGLKGVSNVALLPMMAYAAPRVSSARFDRGRAQIIVMFTSETNKAGVTGGSIDCSLVLSGPSRNGRAIGLGVDNYCVWYGSDVLVINLGTGSSVTAGDRFSFVPNKLAGKGVTYSTASAGAFSSGSFALEDDAEVQFPTAVLMAPQEVGPCADIELSATGTTPMANLEYFWGCSNDDSVNQALLSESGPRVVLSNAYLQRVDFAYKFTLMVKLSGVASNIAMASVHRRVAPVVTTTLRAASVVKAGLPFTVEAVTGFSGCPGITGDVKFEWTTSGLLDTKSASPTSDKPFFFVYDQNAAPAPAACNQPVGTRVPDSCCSAAATVSTAGYSKYNEIFSDSADECAGPFTLYANAELQQGPFPVASRLIHHGDRTFSYHEGCLQNGVKDCTKCALKVADRQPYGCYRANSFPGQLWMVNVAGPVPTERYYSVATAGPTLTIPGQKVGVYSISLKAYITGDTTQTSSSTLQVTVVPGPLSAAVFTGLPLGCESSRTDGVMVGGTAANMTKTFTANMNECQRATTVSSKKVGFDMPILLTPVVSDPSVDAFTKDQISPYNQYSSVAGNGAGNGRVTRYQCYSASGMPCKGFGSQRPQFNGLGWGKELPVHQRFFSATEATSTVTGGAMTRQGPVDGTRIVSTNDGMWNFTMMQLQPLNYASADNNPFYETDVAYNEPLYIVATIEDPSTSRYATAMTTVQFSPVADNKINDFVLTAQMGVYIDDTGMPYVRPNEVVTFLAASGRQPAPISVAWSWIGDNVPGVSLADGTQAFIPAQSLKPGQLYTLRAAPVAAQSELFYDEITFYVDTPPTRGSCSATMTGTESTVTVMCSDFSVPGGTDGFPSANPVAAQLLYQYGYYDTTAQTWSWFSTTPESAMTYCIPAGSVEPWVKIINFRGSATFSKAKFATPTNDCYTTATSPTADCYTAVAALSDSSVAYNGVNGNTVGGKYQAWGQLGRIDLVSQCAAVWASSSQAANGAWAADLNNLVTYTHSATYGSLHGRNPSVGMAALQAANELAAQQAALITAQSSLSTNTAVASKLCTVSELAKLGAVAIKQAADLATVRTVSLAPYQYYPGAVAALPSQSNVTAAVKTIAAVAQTNRLIVNAATASDRVATAATSCGINTATNLAMLGDLAAVSVSQNFITAAALPKRISNGTTFDLGNTVLQDTATTTSYDAFILNAYYDVNADESLFNAYAREDNVTYTDVYQQSNTKQQLYQPYTQATAFANAVYQKPTFATWQSDVSYLGDARSGSFANAGYSAATFKAKGLANLQTPYSNFKNTGYGANAPHVWPAGTAPSARAAEKDFFVNYRALADPTNWDYIQFLKVSNAVYGYTIYPALHYRDAMFTDELEDLFFSMGVLSGPRPGAPSTDAAVMGPIEIVVPVDAAAVETNLSLAAGTMDASHVACASQDFMTGAWSTEFACSNKIPEVSMRPWSAAGRSNPGCIVGAVTATTVTCHCWGSPRMNVLVQAFNTATQCPDCEGVKGRAAPLVKDVCGVCGGDGSTCTDCSGKVNGTAMVDQCGVCTANAGYSPNSCVTCDGVVNGSAIVDVCGVCNGDNTTCLGCAPPGEYAVPIPQGGKVYDACGVCGGSNQTCVGCDNVPYSGKKVDKCQICGGNSNTSYPEFGFTCVGKFITPAALTRFNVTAGNELTLIVKAKASDNRNKIQLDPTKTMPADMATTIKSFKTPAEKSTQLGENVTFTLTWTPKFDPTPPTPTNEPNDYRICLNLVDTTGATVDTRCFLISVVFCQYVANTGETLRTIAVKQFGDEKRSRTLWWLNPSVEYMDQPLKDGARVEVGRRFSVAANDTLKYYVNEFGSTYANVAAANPLKLHYLRGGRNFVDGAVVEEGMGQKPVADIMYHNYHRQVSYDGTEFCIVSEMDSFSRY